MRTTEVPPALWLRDAGEMAKPISRFAVLWPAYEYTVLVFGKQPAGESGQPDLDPFERAIYGASAANVVGIAEQAEIFDLNPHFVAHLHERLMERGVFDDYGRPHSKRTALQDAEVLLAVRVYQDPWSATLWPRFVVDTSRRTVPVREKRGRVRLLLGTTGSPTEVPALYLREDLPATPPPSSDDAVRAIEQWSRLKRSHKLPGHDLLRDAHPSARVLPDSAEAVLLCCPSERGVDARPRVHDPFGGPEWSPFTRALVQRAQSHPPLQGWLFGPPPDEGVEQPLPAALPDQLRPSSLHDYLARLVAEAHGASGAPLRGPQIELDLAAIGQLALDMLMEAAPRSELKLAADPEVDSALLSVIEGTVGFEPSITRVPTDLALLLRGAPGPLHDRCVALLLLYPADQPGPLHALAQRCPLMFSVLRDDKRHDGRVRTSDLMNVVEALVAVALAFTDTPTETGSKHGQE